MTRRWALPGVLLMAGLGAWAPQATAGDSFRCNGHVVEVGDLALRVRSLCGPPSLVEQQVPAPAGDYGAPSGERWTYNFGPRKLLRVLTLRNGRVADIDSDGYGFATPRRPMPAAGSGRACNPYDLIEGLSSYRVLRLCGAPDSRERRQVIVPLDRRTLARFPHLRHAGRQVLRERWVYNFGPDALLRTLTLEDGRVVDVDIGERGFGR